MLNGHRAFSCVTFVGVFRLYPGVSWLGGNDLNDRLCFHIKHSFSRNPLFHALVTFYIVVSYRTCH